MSVNMRKVAYSIDGENFSFDDPCEALQALDDEGRLVDGAVYYEIDVEDVDLSSYLRANRILEDASGYIYDDIGEAAEDAFNPPQDARDELDAILSAWCEKHFAGERYWRCHGRERELIVTAEDVSSVGGTP